MPEIKATMTLRHWLPLKRKRDSGDVRWLSQQGAIIACRQRFPIGAKVYLSLLGSGHRVRRIPADIVRAEPAGETTRYSLRFLYQDGPGHQTSADILKYLAEGFISRDA